MHGLVGDRRKIARVADREPMARYVVRRRPGFISKARVCAEERREPVGRVIRPAP